MTAADPRGHDRTIINLAKMGLDHVYLIGKYSYLGAQPQLETHTHHGMIEICYCEKGQQVYEVEQKEYRLKGGDVFVTFPDEPHSTAEYPEDKGILYWIQIKMPKKEEMFLGYRSEYAQLLTNAILNIPFRHFKGSANIKKILDDILWLGQQPAGQLNTLMVYNLVTNLLLTVVKCTQNAPHEPGNIARVESIKQFIDDNLANNLSIGILAARQYLSESHFKSWFKQEMGIPPMDYVIRERVEKAKQMLVRQRSLSITQIALGLNFSSSQYFATVFKKYTGLTPAEYRNMDKH